MGKITTKTIKYLIPLSITIVVYIVTLIMLTRHFIKIRIISVFNFSHLFLIIIFILIFLFFIIKILNRIIKNESEKKLTIEYFNKYEEAKNILKYSCLTLKEKKIAYKHAQDIFLSTQNHESGKIQYCSINPKRFADDYIESVGYKKPYPLLITLIDSLFITSILLILLQLLSFFFAKDSIGFFEVTLMPFNVLYVFIVGFCAIPLHKYLLTQSKPFIAGSVPIIFTIIYFCLLFGLNSLFSSEVLNWNLGEYIMYGQIMLIRTKIRLILFIFGFVGYFIFKIALRNRIFRR